MPSCRPALIVLLSCCVASGCASTNAVPRPFPRPEPAPRPNLPARQEVSPADPHTLASRVIATALALRGVPYRNGGQDPRGFDCSGLVLYAFARHGVALPRTVAEQLGIGRSIPRDALQPGDLVFFTTVGADTSHVGIALGDGHFIHAPSGSGAVRVDALAARYWSERFVGARRV